ncbi:uncharacterized protein LOC122171582 [Centrocercus urophasianus]|uniref:uncharacterized protein LOC122171582 n=1 Tax=Centrocercus urophasianus TaxID=9002 RepID=UPI001C64AF19|nr:uncharacterized protein LOC122171582 [Centrocercus urophasianus]
MDGDIAVGRVVMSPSEVRNTFCLLQHQRGEQLPDLSSPQPTAQPGAMDVASDWVCPICGQIREDVTYVTPCQHQLCYGCAIWWAYKKPSCAVCGHEITTIRYSVRSDDDFLECAVPQPAAHSDQDQGLQEEQGPAEPVLIPPEHSFPAEVWAAFFREHQEDLEPLLQWLQEEIQQQSSNDWWEVHAGQWTTINFLCEHGLDEEALLQALQPITNGDVVPFVRRLIGTAAALYGPTIRHELDHRDSHAAGGREDGPAASTITSTSHLEPPASGPGRSTSPAGPSAEELPGSSPGGPGRPSTATAPSAEEPQEEPGQAAAAGPSAQGRDRSSGGPRRPPKRKASSSRQDSSPPRKRRPRRRR